MLKLALLIVLVSTATANKRKCSRNNIKTNIYLIGSPVSSIFIEWKTVKTRISGSNVSYRVHYNRTSAINRCNCESIVHMYKAGHCNQQSSTTGHTLQCTLNSTEIAKTHVNFTLLGSICIVVEGTSANNTWYRFMECRSPESEDRNCVTLCPAPENVNITAVGRKSLTVKWDAPSSIDKNTLHDIKFSIFHRRIDLHEKANASQQFKKVDLPSRFAAKNNKYNITHLRAAASYEVKICCSFPEVSECRFFDSRVVKTLEEKPSQAPIITGYEMLAQNLLIKWKAPASVTWNGRILRFELNIWKAEFNCTALRMASPMWKDIETNRTDISECEFQYKISLSNAMYCGRLRMCTLPGCGPWSTIHSTPNSYLSGGNMQSSHNGDKVLLVLLATIAVGIIIILLFVFACLFFRRKKKQRQPLADVADGLNRSITSSTDIENDSEGSNEYAVADGSMFPMVEDDTDD